VEKAIAQEQTTFAISTFYKTLLIREILPRDVVRIIIATMILVTDFRQLAADRVDIIIP